MNSTLSFPACSESESSLEMDEERQFNEHGGILPCPRQRTLSSPIPPPQMSPGTAGSIPIAVTVSHGPHGVGGHGHGHGPHSLHGVPHGVGGLTTPLGRPISPAPCSPASHVFCPNCGYNFIPASASPVLNLRHGAGSVSGSSVGGGCGGSSKDKFIKPSPST